MRAGGWLAHGDLTGVGREKHLAFRAEIRRWRRRRRRQSSCALGAPRARARCRHGCPAEEPDGETIFRQLEGHTDFDPELLRKMLSRADDKTKSGGRCRALTSKPQGIAVLDSARAQNMAIVLSKLKATRAPARVHARARERRLGRASQRLQDGPCTRRPACYNSVLAIPAAQLLRTLWRRHALAVRGVRCEQRPSSDAADNSSPDRRPSSNHKFCNPVSKIAPGAVGVARK